MNRHAECHPNVRRPSHVRAVLMTYWSRPMTWVLLLVFVGAIVLTEFLMSLQNEAIRWIRIGPSIPSITPAMRLLPLQGFSAEQLAKARSISVYGTEKLSEVFRAGALPNLEALHVYGSLTDEQLQKICSQYDLKWFSFDIVDELGPKGWDALQQQTSLQFLEVTRLVESVKPKSQQSEVDLVTWPPNLRTLVYRNPRGLRMNDARALHKLKQLKTVALAWNLSEVSLSDALIEELAQLPKMRELYIEDLQKTHLNQFFQIYESRSGSTVERTVNRLQSTLPSASVVPSMFDSTRGFRVGSIVILISSLFIGLLVQLSTQFGNSLRPLTPQFARVHLTVAATFMILVTVGGICWLIYWGCKPIAAIGLVLCAFPLTEFIVSLNSGFRRTHINRINPAMPFVAYSQMVMAYGIPNGLFPVFWQRFLDGQFPFAAIAMLAVSLLSIYRLIRERLEMFRMIEILGVEKAPLGVNQASVLLKAAERIRIRDQEQNGVRDQEADWAGLRQTPGALLAEGKDSTLAQVFPQNRIRQIVLIAVNVAAVAVGGALSRPWMSDLAATVISSSMLGVTVLLLVMPIQFAVTRTPFHSIELLRPVSRKSWQRLWFTQIAAQMCVASAAILCVIFSSLQMLNEHPFHWNEQGLVLCYFPGIVMSIFGLGMLIMTFRRTTNAIIMFLMFFTSMMAVNAGVFFVRRVAQNPGWKLSFEHQLSWIIGSWMVGVVLIALAWNRWKHWEVGANR